MERISGKKFLSIISAWSLLINQFLPFASVLIVPAYAQEQAIASPAPEPTSSPEASIIPSPSPELSPSPSLEPLPSATASAEIIVPSPSPEISPNPILVSPSPAVQSSEPPQATSPPSNSPSPSPFPEPQVLGQLSAQVIPATNFSTFDIDSSNISSANLTTDKPDYAPTEAAIISGAKFKAATNYILIISSTDEPIVNFETSIITNDKGEFTYVYQLDGNYRPNYKVEVKDSSSQVVASVTFTDGNPKIDKLYSDATLTIENYQFAVEQIVYAKAKDLTPSKGYKLEAKNASGEISYLGSCKTGGTTASDSYAPTTVSGTTDWTYELLEFSNTSCSGGSTVKDSVAFNVAQSTAYVSSALSTTTTTYTTSAIAFIVVSGLSRSDHDFEITWIKPSGEIACTNLGGGDRPDSTSAGRLPDTSGSFLQFPPNATDTGDEWNRDSKYDSTCLAAGSSFASNPGTWSLKVTPKDKPTQGFTLPVFTIIAADTTPPDITSNVSPDANGAGWNNSDVTVSWTVTDSESTITSQDGCDTAVVSSDTSGTTYTCTATSTGGTSSQSVTVKLDTSKPIISGSQSPSANGAGWNNSDVTVDFSCSDDGPSGIASDTVAGTILTAEGSDQSATNTGSCVDNAGNTADSVTVSGINIDKTSPTVQSAETQDLNGDGNIDAIKLSFSENIDDSKLDIGNSDGWDVVGAGGESIGTGDTANDNILLLGFDQGPTPDTGNTPTISYAVSGGPVSTHDTAGNELESNSWVTTDKAPPVLVSASTKDTDANGHIDQIVTKFSESLVEDTISIWNFEVVNYNMNNISRSNDQVTLYVDEYDYNDVGRKPLVRVHINEYDSTSIQDLAGNNATSKELNSLDEAAPITTIDSPSNDSIFNSPISISGNSSDGEGDTISYTSLYYRANGSEDEWTQISESQLDNESGDEPFSWSFDWTPESDGVYDIKAEATDDSNNTEQSPTVTNITYDTTGPDMPTADPAADDYFSEQSVTLLSDDSLSGVDHIFYTTDGTDPSATNGVTYGDPININEDMTLKAIAYDKAGNYSEILSADYHFLPPVISDESSTTITTGGLTVTWTTDHQATSRVIFDTVSHPAIGVAPDYDYANSTIETDTDPKVTSHTVILTGLGSGTTYYYRIVSHGSPEAVGPEHSFVTKPLDATTTSTSDGGTTDGGTTTGGTATTASPVPGLIAGFTEGVLGETDTALEEPQSPGNIDKVIPSASPESVLGLQQNQAPQFIWLILLIIGLIYLIYRLSKQYLHH